MHDQTQTWSRRSPASLSKRLHATKRLWTRAHILLFVVLSVIIATWVISYSHLPFGSRMEKSVKFVGLDEGVLFILDFQHDRSLSVRVSEGIVSITTSAPYQSRDPTSSTSIAMLLGVVIENWVIDSNVVFSGYGNTLANGRATTNGLRIQKAIRIPMLYIAAIFFVFCCALSFRRWLAHRFELRPACGLCGYCLIGVASNRCPECGNERVDD